jgi:hypothetical protein
MRKILTVTLLAVMVLGTVACSLTESDVPEDDGGDYEGVLAPVNAIDKAESAAAAQEKAQEQHDKMMEEQEDAWGGIPGSP